jgi:hypothetical protein
MLAYEFDSFEDAGAWLDGVGFTILGPGESIGGGDLRCIAPKNRPDNYPTFTSGENRKPRFVGIVDSENRVVLQKIYGDDPIVTMYQDELREALERSRPSSPL